MPGSIRSRYATVEAYAIPVTPAVLARNADEAVAAAVPLIAEGKAVAVRYILPTRINQRSRARLNLTTERAVEAALDVLTKARRHVPMRDRRRHRSSHDPGRRRASSSPALLTIPRSTRDCFWMRRDRRGGH